MSRDWSEDEVRIVVEDYFGMLAHELRGERYVKAEHNRAVRRRLDRRSKGSVEYKYQNLSAVLLEHGLPYVPGYKPASNYQRLLASTVNEYLDAHPELFRLIEERLRAVPDVPTVCDPVRVFHDPPEVREAVGRAMDAVLRVARVNWLVREARVRRLGRNGELWVVELERRRLRAGGRPALADRVEHVAQTRGDGAGFDVRSFDFDGSERFIEVKTTQFGVYTPFFVTRNELECSREAPERYWLYRVHDFGRAPGIYVRRGPLDRGFHLDPWEFRALPRARARRADRRIGD